MAPREKSHIPSCVSIGSLTPLRQFKKFPDIPVCTREEHQGSRPYSRRPSSPSSSRKEGLFPCFVGEGIPAFPLHLKRKLSPLDYREELQGSCHHFKRPPMSQFVPDTPDSPAMTRRSPRGPTQNTMAGVTALWHLERKPPIPSDNLTGSLTLLFQLVRRADLHGSTRDEA